MKPLTIDQFIATLREQLNSDDDITVESINRSSLLLEDLGLDSLGLVTVMAIVADLLPEDRDIDVEIVDALDSIESLYEYYLRQADMVPKMAGSRDLRDRGSSASHGLLVGPTVRLVEVRSSHLPDLYQIMVDEQISWRWRYATGTPTYEQFVESFYSSGILEQFVVCPRDADNVLGLVMCYNADLPNRHAYLAVVMQPQFINSGIGVEALGVLVAYVFLAYDFVKLYAESIKHNYLTFASGLHRFFQVEATLRQHQVADGKCWDTIILAIYREHFEELVRILGGASAGEEVIDLATVERISTLPIAKKLLVSAEGREGR